MTYKEIIKKLGLKDFLLYNLLRILEVIINLPYKILKLIVELFYMIFDFLDGLFYKRNLIVISKISKKADIFRIKCFNKIRSESNE